MKTLLYSRVSLLFAMLFLTLSVFAQDATTPAEGDIQGWIPYLKHPLVLAGFVIMLFIGLITTLVKSGTIKLSQASSGKVLNKLITYGFILAILVIVGGFYVASQKDGTNQRGDTSFSNIDQSGQGNSIGNNNNSSQPDTTSGNTTFDNINQSGNNNNIGNNNNSN